MCIMVVTQTVRKAYKTNLSTILIVQIMVEYYSISIDDDYVYYGGIHKQFVKLTKLIYQLSLIVQSYGGIFIQSLLMTIMYYGGGTTNSS